MAGGDASTLDKEIADLERMLEAKRVERSNLKVRSKICSSNFAPQNMPAFAWRTRRWQCRTTTA